VIEVDSAEVAESAKLLENIFRAVNIALVNELKVVLEAMGIDIWKVIAAASTKPFGFMPFYPGPGLGGHCIPIDPFYLSHRARQIGVPSEFIELAGRINTAMPGRVVERTLSALRERGAPSPGARVLVIGLAYKPDIDDVRESPALEIIERLQDAGCEVSYHDPHVPRTHAMRRYDLGLASVPLTRDALRSVDATVIVTAHRDVDWALVAREASVVIDTRNALAAFADEMGGRLVKA
jgi:UDP-N-acetyl-D-glucosamine dehydrogenase